jgi:hypothetical protein
MTNLQWLGLGGLVFGVPLFVLGYTLAWLDGKIAAQHKDA